MSERYIGLMSGTSLDGVDGVLVTFDNHQPRLWAQAEWPMPSALRAEFLALNQPGANEIHRAALAANALMAGYAAVVAQLLQTSGLSATDVRAIGAHGQTVRHQPGGHDGLGYTVQLNQPALLAERTGIDVVADFRSRDLAAGGQGAPLVPAFHQHLWAQAGQTVAVLNLGGIANLSLLHADGRVEGFDTGPANVLLDAWCQRHRGEPFDAAGAWAAQGQVQSDWLHKWLQEPFLALSPPKSTGRDLFDLAWLESRLPSHAKPEDVQATLLAFTAQTVLMALRAHAPEARQVWVCGGGVRNTRLMAALLAGWPEGRVSSTAEGGLDPQWVEATAFAWLACQHVHRRPGNLAAVTGAAGARVLGALYPR
ncbi:MAG: anhydro-N-acetylmuramic acid kinase [Limnohabitans sp.]|nr:anhydro-N-acetylmuramic acid kinase [Limnohabitans sp.]